MICPGIGIDEAEVWLELGVELPTLRLEDLGIRISKVKTHDAWKVET
jgi:hypothetical protein